MSRFDFRERQRVNREELHVAHTDDVRAALLAYCQQTEQADDFDFDLASKVGILLQENPAECDEFLLQWLLDAPSAQRLDLVGALLFGLWLPSAKAPRPRADLVSRLATWRPASRLSPDADFTYVLVMSRVLDYPVPDPTAQRLAMAEIERAAVRGTGNASLDASLIGMRARYRKKLGTAHVPPPAPGFRAYTVSGDPQTKYSIESVASQSEIARILDLKPHTEARLLVVEYAKCEADTSNILVVDAIAVALLAGLLEHRYRANASQVEYLDAGARFKATLDYPP